MAGGLEARSCTGLVDRWAGKPNQEIGIGCTRLSAPSTRTYSLSILVAAFIAVFAPCSKLFKVTSFLNQELRCVRSDGL